MISQRVNDIPVDPEREPPKVKIVGIDQFGLITCRFSEELLVPVNYTEVVNEACLNITIVPANEAVSPVLGFASQTVYFDSEYIKTDGTLEAATISGIGPVSALLKDDGDFLQYDNDHESLRG